MQNDPGSNAAVRNTLNRSEDPRVARTRAAILAAVHTLSDRGAEVTVSAIVRTASISRASFYSHYASLDELAASVRRDTFLAIGDLFRFDAGDPVEALRVSQQRLVAHFVDSRALYAAVNALPVSKEHYLAGVRTMAAVIEETLAEHPALPERLKPASVARYIAGAAYGLLDAWITEELDLTEAEMVDHLTRLLPPWFSGSR